MVPGHGVGAMDDGVDHRLQPGAPGMTSTGPKVPSRLRELIFLAESSVPSIHFSLSPTATLPPSALAMPMIALAKSLGEMRIDLRSNHWFSGVRARCCPRSPIGSSSSASTSSSLFVNVL